MEENNELHKELASIRQLMERSAKFLSLSGLSGILAGVYALIGAGVAYALVYYPDSPFEYGTFIIYRTSQVVQLVIIGIIVLCSSLLTGYWLSVRKAQRTGVRVWNDTGRRLLVNLSIPLVTGGIFILLLLDQGHFGVAAPACLVFYGLALINASPNLFEEVRFLGYSEILLGLIAAALPGYGLLFWVLGFGVLHIVYGALMFKKYDQ